MNQHTRVEGGIQNGSLTNHEVGKLEAGQPHLDRKEANAARNGRLSKAEQNGVQRAENHQSRRIRRAREDRRASARLTAAQARQRALPTSGTAQPPGGVIASASCGPQRPGAYA